MTVRADDKEFRARVRLDTPREREYLRHGGILPYVLRKLASRVVATDEADADGPERPGDELAFASLGRVPERASRSSPSMPAGSGSD